LPISPFGLFGGSFPFLTTSFLLLFINNIFSIIFYFFLLYIKVLKG
jgi:hypothetical protein